MFEKAIHSVAIRVASIAASVLIGLGAIVTYEAVETISIAEASMFGATYDREVREGQRTIEKYKKRYGVVQAQEGDPVYQIQATIVKYNPDKLSFTNHKKRQWILPVYVTTEGSPDWGGESVGGPYITLNHRTVEQLGNDNIKREWRIVERSRVASLIAHECGHKVNHDERLMRLIDIPFSRSSVSTEARADEAGMDLLNNVPEFSIGSFMWARDEVEDRKHPKADQSLQQVIDKLKTLSHGRVILSKGSRLTLDGKKLRGSGYLLRQLSDEAVQRTEYLAGQIASCIDKGVWHKKNLAACRESEMFKDGRSDCTVLAVYANDDPNHSNTPVKILGTFETSIDTLNDGSSNFEKEALIAAYNLAGD